VLGGIKVCVPGQDRGLDLDDLIEGSLSIPKEPVGGIVLVVVISVLLVDAADRPDEDSLLSSLGSISLRND
jgi:hypothetical protein